MVELRSEEVQEVMGRVPPLILRCGTTVLFAVVVCLVVGSCFFKYPDVVAADMTLSGRYPVAPIVSRAAGKIGSLYVSDGEQVQEGALLAVIENPARAEDVFRLSAALKARGGSPVSLPEDEGLELGDVQPHYASYLQALQEYDNYYALDYYGKKLSALRTQIDRYRAHGRTVERQLSTLEAQHGIAVQQYARDSSLFASHTISPSEHEVSRNTLLQSLYSLEGGRASLENLRIQVSELENNVLDMELQQAEKENLVRRNLRISIEQLTNAINGWELSYCLRSPIAGQVAFTKYWNDNQSVPFGEIVFTVVPDGKEELLGKALLPLQRSGKVKTGQRVIVRFANFPDQEFGAVSGIVSSVSLVPSENNYQVNIAFPNGLTTNYGKSLPITYEMKAIAEIVTEDLRLIERFFMPIKRILKEGAQ